uniref:ARAD1B20680p n=1 Tax=Blastobotrys adeninivorans TaxID=409370 RepID=A0A060T6P4_BLAAD
MGFLSGDKPMTAVTTTIDRLTSEGYDEDDVSEIVELMEVITIQPTGPTEAARALRKKLKYGTKAKQLRALTVLDALVQNGGSRLVPLYNDPHLLERLRVTAIESLTDPKVKRKLQAMFLVWAKEYKGKRGYEGLASLYQQLPQKTRNRHRTAYRSQAERGDDEEYGESSSRRRRDYYDDEDEDDGNSNGFGDGDDSYRPSSSARVRSRANSARDRNESMNRDRQLQSPKSTHKKKKSLTGRLDINIIKDKPKLNQAIAEASTAATNLKNALQLVNREVELSTDNKYATECFNKCRKLRRNILKYIHNVESEEYIGALIHANEELIDALRSYDAMSRPPEEDSDSDEGDGDDWKIDSEFNRRLRVTSDSEAEQEDEEDDDPDNPFNDSNVVTEQPVFDSPR